MAPMDTTAPATVRVGWVLVTVTPLLAVSVCLGGKETSVTTTLTNVTGWREQVSNVETGKLCASTLADPMCVGAKKGIQ